ncbi:hypothetical protein R1A27_11810 [Methylobacterium sp. NMS12]|uniref:hypothetical protein n=1 Tax=Methylobacterium sp. NMS12 TaxID=3079766 RepID=UPI003F880F55
MDARNPLDQDEAVTVPARGRRWPGLLVAVVLLAAGLGAAVAFPDRTRETAAHLVAAVTGLFASGNPDPGIDVERAGPVERVFRPSRSSAPPSRSCRSPTSCSGPRARPRDGSPSTTTTTSRWSRPMPAG